MPLQYELISRAILAAAAIAGAARFCAAGPISPPSESPAQHAQRMLWWRDARFGIFIHWGLYAVPAGEWEGKINFGEWFLEETKMPVSQYSQFAKQFNPTKFNAKQWVQIAKDAGMKYLVITSKHHDGFCLWPSKLTDSCITQTPFGQSGRDPLKELSEACKESGIHFGLYYSIMDWHHSDWATRRAWNDVATGTPDIDRYATYMKGQLKELITNYHPEVLWFDGEWESPWTHKRGVDLYNYLRSLDPNLIINNRIDTGRDGMAGMSTRPDAVGDFGTPEQQIPADGLGLNVDWESCMTLNDHWGYNKHDHNWKSPKTIVRNLVDVASKGGNYLLNVGPTDEGLIAQPNIDCLDAVGRWMKLNGDSIYGTSAAPFKTIPSWGRFTEKPGCLYIHVFDLPPEGKVIVPISNEIKKAYQMGNQFRPMSTVNTSAGVELQIPPNERHSIDTVIALEYDGSAPILLYGSWLTRALDVRASADRTDDVLGQ